MVSSKSSTETSSEQIVFIEEEEAAQKEERSLTGGQIAWMICEFFVVSDTDESVVDLDEIVKVDFKTCSRSTRGGTKP